MSRIGRAPILFDSKVQISVTSTNDVIVKGAKSSLKVSMKPCVVAKIEDNHVVLSRVDETKEVKALHGLYRALIQNAITGLSKGFTKSLELHGVGYRASVAGKKLELSLGFSHPVSFDIPEGIEIKVDKQTSISIVGADKGLVGEVAAKVRGFRSPEPYLGKGVRYSDEKIRRKAGKSAGK